MDSVRELNSTQLSVAVGTDVCSLEFTRVAQFIRLGVWLNGAQLGNVPEVKLIDGRLV